VLAVTALSDAIRVRSGRRALIGAAIALVLAATAATVGYYVFVHEDVYRITARFDASTPGLYPGNSVDILGVPTGKIVSVTPRAAYVEVVMSLPSGVQIPADAKAVLMAPNPVSDRFVELAPAYTGRHGQRVMKAGAVIPPQRTFVPLELDAIYDSVDNLSKTLGPAGANAHGALSSVLRAFAKLADGNGADLHTAIAQISSALPALTAHPDDLKNLITGLDSLTGKLAAHDATINALYEDLDRATTQLADERDVLGAAISNLQQGLAEVATFLQKNQARLHGSVRNLNTTIAAILKEQTALVETFDTAPLGFQNFNRAIDPHGACPSATGAPDNCTAIWGRLDLPADVATLLATYCGKNIYQPMLPIILGNLKLADSTATDTDCGAEIGLLQNRTGPPGSPKTPDLDLTHYVGSR
jgi:phospholipid/cholesterol/gamma-HCH transport system substrate-binding protein